MSYQDLLVNGGKSALEVVIQKEFSLPLKEIETRSKFLEYKCEGRKQYEEFFYVAKALFGSEFNIPESGNYKGAFRQLKAAIDTIPDHNYFIAHWLTDIGSYRNKHSGQLIGTKGEEFNKYFGLKLISERRFNIHSGLLKDFRKIFDHSYDSVFRENYGINFTKYILQKPIPNAPMKQAG